VVAPEELLPTCRRLAEDMLSCDPATLLAYKRLIDRGYAESFGEGLRLERRASAEHMKGVTPDTVAARRAAVQQRGRKQQSA
jgi:enoyl-CoA hydratase